MVEMMRLEVGRGVYVEDKERFHAMHHLAPGEAGTALGFFKHYIRSTQADR
jgi:hypothetical protein